jgi:DNA-binding NarL/FixJ family response regulator
MVKTLIVEDSIQYRQLLKEALLTRFPAMDIHEAQDGKEAMQLVMSFHPDLILMDIRLPGQTGLELTQAIKRDFPETNIVILTNYDLPEYREAALKFGANHFLSKGSSNRESVLTLVESILSGRHTDNDGSKNGNS